MKAEVGGGVGRYLERPKGSSSGIEFPLTPPLLDYCRASQKTNRSEYILIGSVGYYIEYSYSYSSKTISRSR